MADMPMSLEGKVCLVTGAGQGLGAAISTTLAEAGATIVAADVREDSSRKLADRLTSEGRKIHPVALDVSNEKQVAQAVKDIYARHDRLDVLVNNAGVDVTVSIEELGVEQWDRIIAVNLRGPFLLSKQVFPLMKARGGGHIINITSTAAKRAWANASAYHASKWGLLGLSHALHVEGRPHHIKVTAIIAGGMRTPFLLERFPDLDPNVLQDPHNVAKAVRFALLQPEETVIPELTVLPMRETSWP